MTTPDPKIFPDLSPFEFQHTLDRSAVGMLTKLEKLRPAVALLRTFSESIERYKLISTNIRVGPKQYPSLYKAYLRAATVLDVRRLPDLYIVQNNVVNAYAMGVDRYTIVVHTGLLDVMNEREVMGVLAHELGHVKCDHMLYNSLTNAIRMLGAELFNQIPVPIPFIKDIFDFGMQNTLLEWSRRAEFSADRAALLATQDIEAVSHMLGKLAGYSNLYGETMSVEALLEQTQDFEELTDDNLVAKYLRVQFMMQQTHPYTSLRVREICQWANSDHYQRILSGKYQRLGEPATTLPQLPKGKLCPRCQTLNQLEYAFCQGCGTNIGSSPTVCGKCKTPVQAAYNFCPSCNSNLQDVKAELPVN